MPEIGKEKNITKELRTNERIRAREVRLIDEKGGQLGIMSVRDALNFASERNLDLVEVAQQANPPVCRLIDYGKFRYEQTKRDRESRKSQNTVTLKEVRMRPKIDDHDLMVKGKAAERFLEGGDKVKMSVVFRGREMAHTDIGKAILDKMAEQLGPIATVDQSPKMEGRAMVMVLSKRPEPKKPKETKEREKVAVSVEETQAEAATS